MASKRPGKIQDLNGMFIYHDPKHGTLYYDIFTKRAFNLTSSDLQKCLIYTAMLPAAVLVSLALITFLKVDLITSVCIGAGAYVLSEILFRVLYFYKLPEITNYKPIKKEESFITSFAKKYSPQRLIVLAILMVLIAICTIIYGRVDNATGYALVGGYVLSACCVGVAIFSLIALAIRKKNNY